ncbi:MAG TPA: galactitol-1-phosphate 5-dehydrogenase, partial [Gammaproteobacteria bacterium]|nr:galactitol-1-phosphate 5-dehydrogenase [Gammaproteobacteria bacterium]
MKALVYTANEEMTYRDEPEPSPQAGEALVAIESVGICGSDMH